METSNFKQKMNLPKSGSFFNYLMSNNASIPTVGNYCTFMHYTDRTVGIVREVSEDGKTVRIEDCDTTALIPEGMKSLPMGHQSWQHQPNGQFSTLRWMNGAWKSCSTEIVFTDEFRSTCPIASIGCWLQENNPELFAQIYDEEQIMPIKVVEGITKARKSYSPVRVLFNECRYYYDWEF